MIKMFSLYSMLWFCLAALLVNAYIKPYLFNTTRNQAQIDTYNGAVVHHELKHLAIIMDGNRRWAKEKGYQACIGHQKGIDPVKEVIEFCIEQSIPHLSLYAFSVENLQRSQDELDHLFAIIERSLNDEEFEKLYKNGIKIKIIGLPHLFPERLVSLFNDLQEKTKHGTQLTLNISFCYGGQQELTDTMQRLGKKIEQGELRAEEITSEIIQNNLWTAESPNPDLVIRTGSCKRLSNFLPWQSTYSELLFLDTYWPDITKQDFYDALLYYNTVKRNFGK